MKPISWPKRVLITTYVVDGYEGGMMYFLELGSYLAWRGCKVDCAALRATPHMKEVFADHGIALYRDDEMPIPLEPYDLVIAHTAYAFSVLALRGLKYRKLVFACLSELLDIEGYPRALKCNRIITLSKATAKAQNLPRRKTLIIPNFVPDSYFVPPAKVLSKGKPAKLALVSNSPAPEQKKAVELLKKKGVKIDIYGRGATNVMINEWILMKYDAVLTMGKTVQYCLALGVPCFVSGKFGHSGYVSMKNIARMESRNFSGRDLSRELPAKELADEILSGYTAAAAEAGALRKFAYGHYRLSRAVRKIRRAARWSLGCPKTKDTGVLKVGRFIAELVHSIP